MKPVRYVVSRMNVRGFHDESFIINYEQKVFRDDKEKVKEILNTDFLKIKRFCCLLDGTSELTFLVFSPSKKKEKYSEKYFYCRKEFEAIHKMCSRFSKK